MSLKQQNISSFFSSKPKDMNSETIEKGSKDKKIIPDSLDKTDKENDSKMSNKRRSSDDLESEAKKAKTSAEQQPRRDVIVVPMLKKKLTAGHDSPLSPEEVSNGQDNDKSGQDLKVNNDSSLSEPSELKGSDTEYEVEAVLDYSWCRATVINMFN